MDHHEQHHQHHRKEREHDKAEHKHHEQQQDRELRSMHPAWYIVVGVALIGVAVTIWTILT